VLRSKISGSRRWLLLGIAALALGLAIARAWQHRAAEAPVAAPDPMTERLRALGYIGDVLEDPDPAREGVTLHDAARAWPGVNVYCSVHATEIVFLSMQGTPLHRLSLPASGWGAGDCMVTPYDDRSILALDAPSLARLDRSSVLWVSDAAHHHDVSVGPDGSIHTLSERRVFTSHAGGLLPVLDHFVTRLDANGRILRQIPLLELFRERVPAERFARMSQVLREAGAESPEYERESDVLHPNTIEILPRDLSVAPAGTALLCLRELDLLAIVDLDAKRVVWSWGAGELDAPHHPSLLDDDHLLVFDNGSRRGASRVIELDPATGRIVWEYRGDPRSSFFSKVRGDAQALPTGNVLITESTKGRVFEITRAGEVVWEFWNPTRGQDGKRRQIYRMLRIPAERFEAFLGR
jgi:Arylsulfotransferase (ASST)